jgi:hypothetical protein
VSIRYDEPASSGTTIDLKSRTDGTDEVQAVDIAAALPAGTNNIGDVDVVTMPVVQVGDNGGSLTVDGTVAVSGTVLVTDNGGTLSVDDGAGSLTVDGSVSLTNSKIGGLGDNTNATDVLAVGLVAFDGAQFDTLRGTAATGLHVDVRALPALTVQSANTSASPIGNFSLGNSLSKTNQNKTGNLVTTATTVDQVILTFTVTAGKTFYLQYLAVNCRLTTFATTATLFGAYSLETPSGTKVITQDLMAAGARNPDFYEFAEPIPIPASTVVRVVCTPAAVTSMTWKASFGGYER